MKHGLSFFGFVLLLAALYLPNAQACNDEYDANSIITGLSQLDPASPDSVGDELIAKFYDLCGGVSCAVDA